VADPRPFSALYEHSERHQWSPLEIDFSIDAESFAALDETTRTGARLGVRAPLPCRVQRRHPARAVRARRACGEIAKALVIEESTVKTRVKRIMMKLRLRDRVPRPPRRSTFQNPPLTSL